MGSSPTAGRSELIKEVGYPTGYLKNSNQEIFKVAGEEENSEDIKLVDYIDYTKIQLDRKEAAAKRVKKKNDY